VRRKIYVVSAKRWKLTGGIHRFLHLFAPLAQSSATEKKSHIYPTFV